MRRVFVRQSEIRVTDSLYELPGGGEQPDPSYLYPPPEDPGLGFFGWFGIVVIVLIILGIASCISNAANAQSNVRDFYGWSDYGGSKNTTINIYQHPVQPQSVPNPPTGQMQCTPSADGTMNCRQQACGIGPDYQWHCQ